MRLTDYLITARDLSEYQAFFGLSQADLQRNILDCPGGAASVVAQLCAAGGDAVAIDPAYSLPADELYAVARADAASASAFSVSTQEQYDWTFYGGPSGHAAIRTQAAEQFIASHQQAPERYIAGSLPDLPLETGSFDLALSSHLLFCYSDRLDADFHIAALRELARVADEVRVFPLIDYQGGTNEQLLEATTAALRTEGLTCELVPVDFRFQSGADAMLVVRR